MLTSSYEFLSPLAHSLHSIKLGLLPSHFMTSSASRGLHQSVSTTNLFHNLGFLGWFLLALLKYPFYYTIRRGFGNFFGMIHVLTRHLAPELDRFRFCLGFWSMLHFGRKLDIFGDVLTQDHNWAKMKNKEKSPHAKDGAERGQKEPRPAGLEPLSRPA